MPYLLRATDTVPVLALTVAGEAQDVVPIRYIEWATTTPLIQVLLGTLADASPALVTRVAVYDFLIIVFGGIARMQPNTAVSLVLAAGACGFGALTMMGMGMLVNHARNSAAADEATRSRCVLVGSGLIATFVAYTIVYFVHYRGGMTTEAREITYAVLDVTAKVAATNVLLQGLFQLHVTEMVAFKQASDAAEEMKAGFLQYIVRET